MYVLRSSEVILCAFANSSAPQPTRQKTPKTATINESESVLNIFFILPLLVIFISLRGGGVVKVL